MCGEVAVSGLQWGPCWWHWAQCCEVLGAHMSPGGSLGLSLCVVLIIRDVKSPWTLDFLHPLLLCGTCFGVNAGFVV